MIGRFAPTPSGPLHLGNLRTALVAWLFARSAGSAFLLRIEDLDRGRSREEHVINQLADLAAIGLDWDGEPVRQSTRADRYEDALAVLDAKGLLYECFCTRAEIREAASAPHGEQPEGAYPGTCRDLTDAERAARRATGRRPALRVRADGERIAFTDRIAGTHAAVVDDLVVRRADGEHAYNLAVVVDDADQGVEEVVRGADLLDSTPRQLWLARELGLTAPRSYAHVGLAFGDDGVRLAKRHRPPTLADLAARGQDAATVRTRLAASLGLAALGEAVSPADLLARFDPGALTTDPVVLGQ